MVQISSYIFENEIKLQLVTIDELEIYKDAITLKRKYDNDYHSVAVPTCCR